MNNLFNKKEYNVMILSGGSTKGFGMLGAIQYLIDQKMVENINTYIDQIIILARNGVDSGPLRWYNPPLPEI